MSGENVTSDEQIRRRHPFAVQCKSCNGYIVWFKTKAGEKFPVNEDSTRPTDASHQFDISRHVNHAKTCGK